MTNIRSRRALNVKRYLSKGAAPVIAIAAMVLTGCGGGGSSPQSQSSAPVALTPPPETLFVAGNSWTAATPVNTETVTPEEFRRRQLAGELQVITPATQQAQVATHQSAVTTERAFLKSKTDLSDDVLALLAAADAANDINGEPVATLPDGQRVALIDLGTRIEKAAQDYRLAHDTANALATYQLSYSLLSDEIKAQVPSPATLSGSTLEQIKQAAQQLNTALATAPDIDKTRLDPDASPTSMSLDNPARVSILDALGTGVIASGPGNGVDNSGACTTKGYAKRYWFPLRSFVSPVRDQGRRGTCWAFAAIGAVESRERVQNNTAPDLSEQFLVNKYKHEWYPSDFIDGASAANAMNAAVDRKQALLSEAGWTYNPSRGRPDNAFATGVVGTLASYAGACNNYNGWCSPSAHQGQGVCATALGMDFCAVNNMVYNGGGVMASRVRLIWSKGDAFNLETYRALLSSGVSLMASFPVYVGFQTAPATGIVSDYRTKQMLADGTVVDGSPGGHLVQIVGFISNEQLSFPGSAPSTVGGGGYFIIRNSWGCTADGGYYYIPADYVSSLFSTLEVLDFDAFRSARWKDEQVTPGGTTGLAIDPKGTQGVDLRVQENLANSFTVTHPVANYVHLTVTSNRDGLLFDGQWLTNAPIGGSLFANSLPVTFQTEDLRTLTITARYGTQVVSVTKDVLVLNSPPSIALQSTGTPQQGEDFVINAIVTDRNEANPASICNAMTWTVSAPDTIVSGSGCTRVVKFGVTGARDVRVDSADSEGRAGAAVGTFTVGPPPVNPYPRVTAFNVYSRDYLRISNIVAGCQSNVIANNATIDLRQLGCVLLGIGVPDRSRYFAQISLENPSAETLSYDWTYTAYYPSAAFAPVSTSAHTTTPSYDMTGLVFGARDTPYACTVDVRVNTPEASRNKSLRVWSGRCINVEDAPH